MPIIWSVTLLLSILDSAIGSGQPTWLRRCEGSRLCCQDRRQASQGENKEIAKEEADVGVRHRSGSEMLGTACEERGRYAGCEPEAMDQLKRGPTKEQFQNALSPKPDTVALTDILLDAWSMTTITGRMPGRPPVAPWLRGVSDEEPQTTIAWRAELDLDGFEQLDTTDIDEWFDAHRVLPHESLAVPTSAAREWILNRWRHLGEESQATVGDRPCIVDRAGLQVLNIKSLVDELERNRTDSIRGSDIVLPASFGGIRRGEGLLNENAPDQVGSLDGSDGDPLMVSDVADERARYRLLRSVDDGVEKEEPLVGAAPQDPGSFARFTLDLPGDGDTAQTAGQPCS